MGDFVMPSLGADMEVGALVEWRVQPGDAVHRGDIVAVVDTEKSTIEVEVFEDGIVTELLAAPGDELPVGAPLARIGPPQATAVPGDNGQAPVPVPAIAPPGPGETTAPAPAATPPEAEETTAPAPAATPPEAEETTAPVPAATPPEAEATTAPAGAPDAGGPVPGETISSAPTAPARPRRRQASRKAPAPARGRTGAPTPVRASPLARRRAREAGVDLAEIEGSGPGGAVVAADLERGRGTETPATTGDGAPTRRTTPGGDRQAAMRRATGALMARSKREIPHYYLATTVDLAAAMAWLDRANAERPVTERLLPGVLLLRATALAARRVPELNGYWEDGFRPAAAVHLGVAVSLRGGGLVAPAIHDADGCSLDALMAALRDLVARARAGTLRSSDVTDPTITVTNLGDQGVDEVHGVIYPPQVALVGFGRVAERPWADGGMLGVRPTVRATLAADHRATDGLVGARFLNTIDRLLQAPEEL